MTKQECEHILMDMLEAAYNVYLRYNPEGVNLELSVIDGNARVCNNWPTEDKGKQLYALIHKGDLIHFKVVDGRVVCEQDEDEPNAE